MGTMILICKNYPMTIKYTEKDVETSPQSPIQEKTAKQIGGVI